MKYVLDENGNIKIGKNGNPLIDPENGQEPYEVDAIGAQQKISEISSEAKKYRKEKAELKTQLESIPEEIRNDPAKATEAMTTVSSLSDKHKLDIEGVKTGLQKVFDENLKKKDDEIKILNETLYTEKISSKFAKSDALKDTIFDETREVAESHFSKHFSLDEKGNVVGKIGDNVIYSKEKPGELANFDECMKAIISNHPAKDKFMKPSGQKGSGGFVPGSGGDGEKSSHDMIKSGIASRKAQ